MITKSLQFTVQKVPENRFSYALAIEHLDNVDDDIVAIPPGIFFRKDPPLRRAGDIPSVDENGKEAGGKFG